MLSRESVYRIVGGRSPSEQRVAIGADADGRFTEQVHTGYSVMPPYGACPEKHTLCPRALHRSRTFEIIKRHVELDLVTNPNNRAPGEAIRTLALGGAVHEPDYDMSNEQLAQTGT